MKNGTLYAGRLKKTVAKLKRTLPTPDIPEPCDPIHAMALAILGLECGNSAARKAVDRLREAVVDWNEVRVSSPFEINKATGNVIPHGIQRAQQLADALQSVYQSENRLSLDRLRSMGRRDARHFLEALDGVDVHAAAYVILWSLGGHAIPVDEPLLETLRRTELVHPAASRGEVQAFLERHIAADEVKAFCIMARSLSNLTPERSKTTRRKAPAAKKAVSKRKAG